MEETKPLIYPDAEFLALASAFAAWYDSFSADTKPIVPEDPLLGGDAPVVFTSNNGTYTIKLYKELKDYFGQPLNVDFRISALTTIIEVSLDRLLSNPVFSKKYVFLLTIWCKLKKDNFSSSKDEDCDDATLEFVTTKYPDITFEDVVPGLVSALWIAPSQPNKDRVINLLRKYYYKKTNQNEIQ